MAIPTCSPFIIVGAGIHGLSTAYHLALQLKATGKGVGRGVKACTAPGALFLPRTSR